MMWNDICVVPTNPLTQTVPRPSAGNWINAVARLHGGLLLSKRKPLISITTWVDLNAIFLEARLRRLALEIPFMWYSGEGRKDRDRKQISGCQQVGWKW